MVQAIAENALDWFVGCVCLSLVATVFAVAFALIAVVVDYVFWRKK
jgi:hypothetical protein|nr:MAG TPA: hypothetical protein [Caudoviricetes sp.]